MRASGIGIDAGTFRMGEPVVPPACVSRAPGALTLAQRAHVLRGALTPACVSRAPDRARGCAAHRRPLLLHLYVVFRVWDQPVGGVCGRR